MRKISISTPFITLGQLLKYIGIVSCGGEIKTFLEEKQVKINGILENRRGRKLYSGDEVVIDNEKIVIFNENQWKRGEK